MSEAKHRPNRTNRPNEPEPDENLGHSKDVRDMGDVQTGSGGNAAYTDGAFGDAEEPYPIPQMTGSDDDAYPDNRETREALESEGT